MQYAAEAGVEDPALDAAVISAEAQLTARESDLWAAEVICHLSKQTVSYRQSAEYISLYEDYAPQAHPNVVLESTTDETQTFYGVDPDDSSKSLLSVTGTNSVSSSIAARFLVSADTTCDIVAVGAGGGGSHGIGGGGGAGAVVFMQNHVLKAGYYQLIAGPGGSGGTTVTGATEPGSEGASSFINCLSTTSLSPLHEATIEIYGGGGSVTDMSVGGSGGGGDGWSGTNASDTLGQAGGSGVNTTNVSQIFDSYYPVIYTNDGGNGISSTWFAGGGGGGAGGNGGHATTPNTGTGGIGGDGITIFGTTYAKGGNGSGRFGISTQPTELGSGGNGGGYADWVQEDGIQGLPGVIKIFFHNDV